MPSRKDNVDITRGMALAAAAALAGGEAVNTEVREDFDNEQLTVRGEPVVSMVRRLLKADDTIVSCTWPHPAVRP